MNSSHWFRLAAAAVGLTLAVVLALAVPTVLWTTVGVVAAVVLVLSVGGLSGAVLPVPPSQRNATGIWLIGPAGAWTGVLIAVALAAFLVAVLGMAMLGWILVALWLGTLVVGWTFLRAATGIVAAAAAQTSSASQDARSSWLVTLRTASAGASPDKARVLDSLANSVQFAATSLPGAASSDEPVQQSIDELLLAVDDVEELSRRSLVVQRMLAQRELVLRASRTRA